MKKLRIICALSSEGKLVVIQAILDEEADKNSHIWKSAMKEARLFYDNVLVVTTSIDVNKIIDMFMETGQILSSEVQMFKEAQ